MMQINERSYGLRMFSRARHKTCCIRLIRMNHFRLLILNQGSKFKILSRSIINLLVDMAHESGRWHKTTLRLPDYCNSSLVSSYLISTDTTNYRIKKTYPMHNCRMCYFVLPKRIIWCYFPMTSFWILVFDLIVRCLLLTLSETWAI